MRIFSVVVCRESRIPRWKGQRRARAVGPSRTKKCGPPHKFRPARGARAPVPRHNMTFRFLVLAAVCSFALAACPTNICSATFDSVVCNPRDSTLNYPNIAGANVVGTVRFLPPTPPHPSPAFASAERRALVPGSARTALSRPAAATATAARLHGVAADRQGGAKGAREAPQLERLWQAPSGVQRIVERDVCTSQSTYGTIGS